MHGPAPRLRNLASAPRDIGWTVAGLGACITLAILVATWLQISKLRHMVLDHARGELARLNVALAEHTERTVAAADIILSDLIKELPLRGLVPRPGTAYNPVLQSLLHDHVVGQPSIAALAFADAEGRLVAHSHQAGPYALSLAERPYFQAALKSAGEAVIGTPVVGHLSGRSQFNLARALVDGRGKVLGVLVAGIDIGYFQGFYRAVVTNDGGLAALFRRDGELLASYPDLGDGPGRSFDHIDLFRRHLPAAPGGVFRASNTIDGRDRLVSYQSVQAYPLVVNTTVDEAALFAPWWASVRQIVAVAAASLVLLGLAMGVILAQIRREREQKRRLAESEEHFRLLVERAGDALYLHDLEGRIVMANQEASAVRGVDAPDRMVGLTMADIIADYDPSHWPALWRSLTPAAPLTVETRHRRGDGRAFPVEVRLGALEKGGQCLVLALARDVSERKAYEEWLRRQANFDTLTGLPNRLLCLDRLGQALSLAERNGHGVAVLFIDLDGFKAVNDQWGHSAGDAVLIEAGRRIGLSLRDSDTVARLGGDEFVVILPEVAGRDGAQAVAAKIVAAFAPPFLVCGREARLGASIGIALSPEQGQDPETLLRHADAAMYGAKRDGRSSGPAPAAAAVTAA